MSVSLLATVLCLLASPAAAQVRVSTLQEAIERWSPRNHVYVMGDVGMTRDALSELESSLAGGHWTVLLVQDASGQTFHDFVGVTREGADAIEYGMGQGMARAAGFASQVHPKTGEPDGTILTVVLAQRALLYTASEAQDNRGVGDAAFKGNLDRWAIAALRNNGDVAGAVRDTVANVDSMLTAEIERAPREAREAIASAEATLKSLDEAAAALRDAPPHPTGGLAHPDTRSLLEQLDQARAQVETEPDAARTLALNVKSRAEPLEQAIRSYPSAAVTLGEGWRRYRELNKRTLAAEGAEPLEAARLALVDGQALYRNADPAYAGRLDQALRSLSWAEEAMGAAEAKVAAETANRRALTALVTICLIFLLSGLNLLRHGRKEEAEELLDSWQTALDRKLEALFGELEQRVSRIVGPVSDGGRGEETDALAASVRTDVGALIILWTSARSVLEQAREQIHPRETKARIANLFLPGRYRKGIALLRDEPVPFDPGEGLPRLFEGAQAERGWREDLLGDLKSYEPFRKSFEELIEEFHTRAERATQGLDDLETALTRLPELVESLHDKARPLPVAAAALEEARKTMADDPVKGLRHARRAGRAVELADRLPQVRSEIEAGERRIGEARRELGATLGIDPESLLRETDQDPAERLAAAVRQADAVETALGLGEIDGAGSALEQAKQLILEATAFVDRTLEAGRSWERAAAERRAETGRLAALVPEHEALALQLREELGQSDETLESGGIEGARRAIAAAQRDFDAASATLREGRVLAAAAQLRQAAAHQQQAAQCLAEIKDTLERLREEARAEEERRRREEEDRREWERRQEADRFASSSSSASYSSSSSSSGSSNDSDSGSGRSSWDSSGSGTGRSGW
jgi:hypothetical protein